MFTPPLAVANASVVICFVWPVLNVFVFDDTTLLVIVASIFTTCEAKFAPKSNFKVVVDGAENITEPSWLLPVILNTSPAAPEPPEPVDTIETMKSFSATPLNVSLDEQVIVISPSDDNVPVNCLLIFSDVSTTPELAVVFKVLVVLWGNLIIAVFLSASWSFALVLVTIPFVVTSEPPTLADSSICVSDIIKSTTAVVSVPASSINDILSPIFNSFVNLVPKPCTALLEFATVIVPVSVNTSPLATVLTVSAV